MTDVSVRHRPSRERERPDIRALFRRAARHWRLERRSMRATTRPPRREMPTCADAR